MKVRNVIRAGAVVAASVALVSVGEGMELTAAHLPAQPQRGIPYHDVWKIVGVSGVYETSGPSYPCVYAPAKPVAWTANCSQTITVTDSLTGRVAVSQGDISAAVGYTVGESFSVSSGFSYPVGPGQSGEISIGTSFRTRTITQEEFLCSDIGSICDALGNYATAYTSKFNGVYPIVSLS